jgi:phosphoserine phosphatase
MKKKKPIIALIYDFDGTLSPGNMQEYGFIPATGLTKKEFWQKNTEIKDKQDASEILCYMRLMIDEAKYKNISLKKATFREFGKKVELYDGVKDWFALINEYGKKKSVTIEHYINSSGLSEIIEGTPIAKEFKKIYACSFMYDASDVAIWPAVAVDFTAKTQFLFMINKGVENIKDNKRVNEFTPDNERPIPFKQMIYFGDGETDIPCMKLIKQQGGFSIAVYKKRNTKNKTVAQGLIKHNRVNFACPADYSKDKEIYNVVTKIIDKIIADLEVSEMQKLNTENNSE